MTIPRRDHNEQHRFRRTNFETSRREQQRKNTIRTKLRENPSYRERESTRYKAWCKVNLRARTLAHKLDCSLMEARMVLVLVGKPKLPHFIERNQL